MIKKSLVLFCLLLSIITGKAQKYKDLQEQAAAEAENGNLKKAIEVSGQALALAAQDKKADQQEVISLRSENAAYYLLDEQVEKGAGLFGELLAAVEGKSLPVAEMNVKLNYGIALVYLGGYAEAQPFLERARELGRTNRIKAQDLVSCIASLAVCHQYQYHFSKAEELFNEAANICKREGLANTVEHADLQRNIALLYCDMQQPHKAKESYEKAEKIFLLARDTVNPQFPVFLLEYGAMLADAYLFENALSYTLRSRNANRQLYGENSHAYASSLNNLGYIYDKMNKVVETEQFYNAALAIKKSLSFQRLDSYLTSLSNLMVFYANTGREPEAKALAAELEEAMKRKDFTDTLKRAAFANNLGIHYKDWGNYEKSYHYLNEALKYYEAIYGPDNLFSADIYMDMGILYFAQSKWSEIGKSLGKASDIYKKRNAEESASSVGMFCNLAIILKELNKPDEGMKYADKALELIKKHKITQPDVLEQAYMSKAQICADLERIRESMEYFTKYLDLRYAQLERNFSYMTEGEKLFFLEEFEQNIQNYYSVILNNIQKYPELIQTLLDFRLRTKSLLLNNLSKIKEKISNDKELQNKFEEMKLKRESMAKLMNFNTEEYPDALAEAETMKKQADLLEKEISLKVSGSFTGNEKQVDWRTVQKHLGPGEAAIEVFQSYLVYDNNQGKGTNYTFIILKAEGEPIALSIDRPINWESTVMLHYRNSVEQKKNDASLYARVWQFMSEKLADCKTIYLSPDGIYNQINPNTLFNGQSGKYLLEEKNIHLLGSLKNIPDAKETLKQPATCVLAGNPNFDLDLAKANAVAAVSAAPASRGAYGFVLSELPGTKTEIDNLEKVLKDAGVKTTVLTEEMASEKNIKQVKSPEILHVATHGFFLEDVKDEELSGYSKMEKEYYKNPMLRCGIFLSGANKTYSINTQNAAALGDFEDGMLTAYEAMNLNLDNTRLVVLSACETGLGKIKNGEGVFGLQRAFRLAGADAVMMSLWPVSDDATKDLMSGFYSKWMAKKDMYVAFKEAQIELKQKYPEPYYWGAFILVGK